MKKNEMNKILNRPVEESGLSINTINLLKLMGCSKISDIISDEPLSYENIYEKVMTFSNLYCKMNISLDDLQHSYIELIQYLRYCGIKFLDEHQTQKTISK